MKSNKSKLMLTPTQARITCGVILDWLDRNPAIKRAHRDETSEPLYAQADRLTMDIQKGLMQTEAMNAVADELDKKLRKKQAKLI